MKRTNSAFQILFFSLLKTLDIYAFKRFYNTYKKTSIKLKRYERRMLCMPGGKAKNKGKEEKRFTCKWFVH
jgi:membrane protein implicated in regulation of membrane protease activity